MRWRLRTIGASLSANLLPVRIQGTHPECVPTVRTELRTCCAQFAQLLRIQATGLRWCWRVFMPVGASRDHDLQQLALLLYRQLHGPSA